MAKRTGPAPRTAGAGETKARFQKTTRSDLLVRDGVARYSTPIFKLPLIWNGLPQSVVPEAVTV